MLTYEPNYDIFVEALLFAGICCGAIMAGIVLINYLRLRKEDRFFKALALEPCNCDGCRYIRGEMRQDLHAEEDGECTPGHAGSDEEGAWLNGWAYGIDDIEQYSVNLSCGRTTEHRTLIIESEEE